MVDEASLSGLVRRVDEDRWLAARFAEKRTRERLIAIYAVNHEIAKTAEIVRETQLGAIRLAWWRDAIGEIGQGRIVRAHPAAQALAAALPLPLEVFQTIVEARHRDLEATPFATWADLEDYADATAGGVVRLALAACGAHASEDFIRAVGRAWSFTGLLRARESFMARGRRPFPAEGGAEAARELSVRARTAYDEARTLSRSLHSDGFAAYGYAALVPGYLRSVERPLLERQLRLLWASIVGRV